MQQQLRQEGAVPSPCTGVCKMKNEQCLGCQRTLDEIAGWGGMADTEKQAVLARIAQRRAMTEKNHG